LAFALKRQDYAATEVVVLPPFTALRSVQTLVMGDKLELRYGAQDVSEHDDGAYTGDVSGSMLAKLGCSYVLAGHSERRQYHGARGPGGGQGPGEREGQGRVEGGPGADRVRGRAPGDPPGGAPGQPLRVTGGRGTGRPEERAGGRLGHRLRADLGDRHRGGGHAAGRAGGRRGHS